MTGFPPEVRAIVEERAGGSCERCGLRTSDIQLHHRRPRQQGGSKRPDTNTASNCLALCAACHRIVESYRTQAYDDGQLLRSGTSPITEPVMYRGALVLLDDEGHTYRTLSQKRPGAVF